MRIKQAAVKNPLSSRKQIFERAGVSEIPRTSRCRHLQTIAKMTKPAIRRNISNGLENTSKQIFNPFYSGMSAVQCLMARMDGAEID